MIHKPILFFSVILYLLFLCGCSNDGYENWYNAGYQDGYNAAIEELSSRAVPTPSPTSTPRPTSTPKPTSKPTPAPTPAPTQAPASDDFTVYVSRSGTMHLKENCSGMTHSTAMPYSVASQYYDKKCGNCFKKDPS